jgi:hypothetical protein
VVSIPGIPSANGDGVIDINGPWRTLQKRSKSGALAKRAKTSIDIKADPLLVDPDAKDSATIYAGAIRDIIQRQIRGISKRVSTATVERRERASRNTTSRSYKRRYAGGRTGETPPDPNSTQWASDSDRLVNGIVVGRPRASSRFGAAVTVNVPANRLEPISFGVSQFASFRDELRRLVPAMDADFTSDAQSVTEIRKALAEIADMTLSNKEADYRRKLAQRRKLVFDILVAATGSSTLRAIGRLVGQ